MSEVRIAKEEKLHTTYLTAYINELKIGAKDVTEKPKNIVKIIYYGVKYAIGLSKPRNKEEAESQFLIISGLKSTMSLLTLKEFMTIFPISKIFDGEKYQIKDYYSTIDVIKELGLKPNKPIGENILEFILEYMNKDIMNFTTKGWLIMSAIRGFDGHIDLSEEFMAQLGMDTPNTFKNSKGEALYIRHGKTHKIEKNKQSHLTLIKKSPVLATTRNEQIK